MKDIAVTAESSTFSIIENLRSLNELRDQELEKTVGEITDGIEKLIDMIDQIQGVAVDKVERISYVVEQIKSLRSEIEGRKKHFYNEYKKSSKQLSSVDNSLTRLKESTVDLMNHAKVKSIKTIGGRNLSIINSKKLEIYDEELALQYIPEEYKKVTIDKAALKKHIEATNLEYQGVALVYNQSIRGL